MSSPPGKRPPGRPRKGDGAALPHNELDRILVEGEQVRDGDNVFVRYPTYRELAERYGVDLALIAQYSNSHNCMYRRQEMQACIRAEAESKTIAKRAKILRVSRDFQLQLVDQYLMEFKKALDAGRVRCDSPGDLNNMIRLREYLLGGVDSRKEVQTTLSLEVLQTRHLDMMRVVDAASPAERGEDDEGSPALLAHESDTTNDTQYKAAVERQTPALPERNFPKIPSKQLNSDFGVELPVEFHEVQQTVTNDYDYCFSAEPDGEEIKHNGPPGASDRDSTGFFDTPPNPPGEAL